MRCAMVGAGVRKAAGDLFGSEAADLRASVSATCASEASAGMAAGEDESQAIVFELFLFIERGRLVGERFCDVGAVFEMFEALVAALLVDGLEAPRGHQPGHGVLRQTF
jgi:hypothetical protein